LNARLLHCCGTDNVSSTRLWFSTRFSPVHPFFIKKSFKDFAEVCTGINEFVYDLRCRLYPECV
jgi:hypothetical protein